MTDHPKETPDNGGLPRFAKRLRWIREQRGWTQKQLALATKLDASQIAHFELGHRLPSCTNLCRLADALICSTDYLLGRSDALSYDRPLDALSATYARLSSRSQHLLRVLADAMDDMDGETRGRRTSGLAAGHESN